MTKLKITTLMKTTAISHNKIKNSVVKSWKLRNMKLYVTFEAVIPRINIQKINNPSLFSQSRIKS